MPSAARDRYELSQTDVTQLRALHDGLKSEAGVGAPKVGAAALNKSSIVFICSLWEAYCEDVAQEALTHLTTHLDDPGKLPTAVRQSVLDAQAVDAWQLAGDGWKTVVLNNLAEAIGKFNTPKKANVRQLFAARAGIVGVPACWRWQNTDPQQAGNRLDTLVELRGGIAHGRQNTAVRGQHVERAAAAHGAGPTALTGSRRSTGLIQAGTPAKSSTPQLRTARPTSRSGGRTPDFEKVDHCR